MVLVGDMSTDLVFVHLKLMDSQLEERIGDIPEPRRCNPLPLVLCRYLYDCIAKGQRRPSERIHQDPPSGRNFESGKFGVEIALDSGHRLSEHLEVALIFDKEVCSRKQRIQGPPSRHFSLVI